MNDQKLIFPLTVDFSPAGYWIGHTGPYKYAEAVTAFLDGTSLTDDADNNLQLAQELEVYLRAFGSYLHPYAQPSKDPDGLFHQLEQSSARCSINYAYHTEPGVLTLVERYVFPSLRDFLYVELGKGILRGNSPRQCRLCGQWFLHEQGDRAIYCERIAPGEDTKTCREVGARAVFENKLQSEDAWKIYKRAYKKYYARMMKGTMSKEDFSAWAEQAAKERDATDSELRATADAIVRNLIAEKLKEKINQI